jgi:DNA-binding NarL/FixJ family response regulator
LIVDDDATIRMLLRRLLGANPDWAVCGEAVDGVEAVQKVMQLAPDLTILDLSMPRMNGLDTAREIGNVRPGMPLLLVTVQHLDRFALESIREAGFQGAVTKENGAEVVKGVEAVLRGECFFPTELDGASPEILGPEGKQPTHLC